RPVRRVELAAGGVLNAADITCEFNGSELHTETDAEVRNVVLTGKANGRHFTVNSALAESARNQHAMDVVQCDGNVPVIYRFGIDIDDIHFGIVGDSAVNDGFVERLVTFFQIDVFTDDAYADGVLRIFQRLHHFAPAIELRRVA